MTQMDTDGHRWIQILETSKHALSFLFVHSHLCNLCNLWINFSVFSSA
jgi:hypothetical protein